MTNVQNGVLLVYLGMAYITLLTNMLEKYPRLWSFAVFTITACTLWFVLF